MSANGFYTPEYCKNAIYWRIDRLTDKLPFNGVNISLFYRYYNFTG